MGRAVKKEWEGKEGRGGKDEARSTTWERGARSHDPRKAIDTVGSLLGSGGRATGMSRVPTRLREIALLSATWFSCRYHHTTWISHAHAKTHVSECTCIATNSSVCRWLVASCVRPMFIPRRHLHKRSNAIPTLASPSGVHLTIVVDDSCSALTSALQVCGPARQATCISRSRHIDNPNKPVLKILSAAFFSTLSTRPRRTTTESGMLLSTGLHRQYM